MAVAQATHDMSEQLSVRIGDDLQERLRLFRESQRFPPDKSVVVRDALDHYLPPLEELEE